MTQIEMLQALFENPKRKAKHDDTDGFIQFTKGEYNSKLGWFYDNEQYMCDFILTSDFADVWTIIEPERKLKEMSFGEVVYNMSKNKIKHNKIKSVITGLSFDRLIRSVSLEEYLGNWTVEGIYEEVV